ncbi:hypothetical protein [Noviherbaspirillum sp. Root189]|uniref:hypothetical protein n=1 Tax=Noviherbaspirillum sp. Root189 TaxID=1736487 RepID=UPI00070CFDB8|nr:hypothetical protein [Noviherbaspirillum sp. Root189]KRB79052.1 hypothetical protein ASE07_05015 [Noviherbaspirillum sp. Root189]
MSEQTNLTEKEASLVIEAFLAAHPHPSAQQWKELTLIHPQYAAQIAEISLMFDEGESDDEIVFDAELFNATRSLMLNAVHANTGPVAEARTALKQCRGPAARKFARQIGLGEHVDLFNQVISGEVSAPYVLIKRLAEKLQVQLAALANVFQLNFQLQPKQSFSSDGKPGVDSQPVSWEEAIRAAGISGEEATRLLHLDKEVE